MHRLVRRAPSRLPESSLFTFKDKEKFLISPDLLALTADAADLQGETSIKNKYFAAVGRREL